MRMSAKSSTPVKSTQNDKNELQMISQHREMRKKCEAMEREEVRLQTRILQLELTIVEASDFLENRREDGVGPDFPYDSRPLRKLRDAAAVIRGRA